MTIREITEKLLSAGIEEAAFEASLLVEHFMKVSRAKILADGRDADYPSDALEAAVEKRCARYPLQYIIGKWEFCGLEFEVNENCLIPRPDTEIIVEEAVKNLRNGGRYLDLCTGSGCIAAAVLSLTAGTSGYAVELYPETAALAEKNINALGFGTRCTVITGDATTDLFPNSEKFCVITANPPYITSDEMKTLEPELASEPVHALTDGSDGLSIIRGIVRSYKDHLADDGVMIIEHGSSQAEALSSIAAEHDMEYSCLMDYGKNCRGAVLKHRRTAI